MVEKETSLQKIKRLISTQKNIRNVATSAHIHHGKCISGNSRIMFSDGKIKLAKDIFEDVSKDGKIYEEDEEHTVFIPKEKIEIFSLNKINGNIERKPIQYVWRLKGGNTIKTTLRNGFEITTTPEHKYIVYRDGFADVEAKDIKIGDRVVCARKIKVDNQVNIKEKILKLLSKKNFYINLEDNFSKLLKDQILEYKIDKLKLDLKKKSFYHGIWQNRYNLKDLIEICKTFSINLDYLYDKIKTIYFRTEKQRGQNSISIKLPQNFEEFFYLAGLFLGDGSGKKFIVGKESLGNKLREICDKLGFNARKAIWGDKTPEIHTNLTLAEIFNSIFDYPLKKKSHNIKISEFVWESEDRYIAHLLRGYFDTDGCVEKSRRAITISSASNRMLKDLHLLLLRFGCVAIKEKDNTLTISGISAINFKEKIGFGLEEKAEKLKILAEKVCGSIVCDTIKVGNQVMLINKKIKDYSANELAYIEVKKIESGYEGIVYDFTIPENHNFIAEGIVIHNTAFTDNLLAAAGLMAEKSAGDLDAGMATWQHSDEQERLMTVDAANVSMAHEFHGEEYLVNLIDTPGHVDFSGNVTRAMRAIDGTFVLVCASEGIMPQTETVLKQALRERVKPVLFINKVDRLIKELKLNPKQIQEKLMKIIEQFNHLVMQIAEQEYKEKWQVSAEDGSVAFGSARDNWALSVPFMRKKGITFKDVVKIYEMEEIERRKWVWEKAPLYEVVLDMAVKHLPNPLEAQKYRIPKIWKGDPESKFGQDLVNCNQKGDVAFIITRIVIDPRSGKEIAAGRLYSGTIVNGMEVYANNAKKAGRPKQAINPNFIKKTIELRTTTDYGSEKLHFVLKRIGFGVSQYMIQRILDENNLTEPCEKRRG